MILFYYYIFSLSCSCRPIRQPTNCTNIHTESSCNLFRKQKNEIIQIRFFSYFIPRFSFSSLLFILLFHLIFNSILSFTNPLMYFFLLFNLTFLSKFEYEHTRPTLFQMNVAHCTRVPTLLIIIGKM